MAKSVRLEDFPAVLAKDLQKLHQRVVLAVYATAGDGVSVVRANAPKAFEELADGIIGQSLGDAGARIRSTAPHSGAVENGSRPHMPPLEPIIAWVKLRGFQAVHHGKGAPAVAKEIGRRIKRDGETYEFKEIGRGPNKGMLRRRKVKGTDIDAPRQVAWMIALKIKARGTKPTWFMKRSVPVIYRMLDQRVKSYLAKPL